MTSVSRRIRAARAAADACRAVASLVAMLLGLEVLASPALAQVDPYPATIESALAEYDRGNYDEALALFHQAHELRPSARTLRGLGKTSFELRRYVDAIGYFEAALSSTENPLTPEQRTEIEGLLARAQAFLATIVIVGAPDDAEIRVDGRSSGARAQVDAGEHDVEVTRTGHRPFEARVTVGGGETETVEVALVTLEASGPRVIPGSDGLLVPSIILLSAGGAALLGFGIAGGLALGEQGRLEGGCGMARTCAPEDVATMDALAIAADVMLTVGLVSAAAGALLILIDPPHGDHFETVAVAPVVSPDLVGFVAGGTF